MEVLNHPNLIRLYEVIESVDKVHLVTEWAPAGDLYSKVKANGKIGEPDAKFIFRQIIDAVLYMVGIQTNKPIFTINFALNYNSYECTYIFLCSTTIEFTTEI